MIGGGHAGFSVCPGKGPSKPQAAIGLLFGRLLTRTWSVGLTWPPAPPSVVAAADLSWSAAGAVDDASARGRCRAWAGDGRSEGDLSAASESGQWPGLSVLSHVLRHHATCHLLLAAASLHPTSAENVQRHAAAYGAAASAGPLAMWPTA